MIGQVCEGFSSPRGNIAIPYVAKIDSATISSYLLALFKYFKRSDF
jgi:hypothetical protein